MTKQTLIAIALAGVSAMNTWDGGPTYTMKFEKVNNVNAYKIEVKKLPAGGFIAFSAGKPSTKPKINSLKFTGTDTSNDQITDWYYQEGGINFKKDGNQNVESKTVNKESDGTYTMSAYVKFATGDGDKTDGDDIVCGYKETWRWHGQPNSENIDSASPKEGNISVDFALQDCAMTVKDIAILVKNGGHIMYATLGAATLAAANLYLY